MLNLPWYPHMLTKGELGVINYVILLHMLTTTNLDTQHSKLYFHSIIISWQPTTHNTHTHLILPCPLPAKVLPLSLHVAVYIYIYIRVDIYIYILLLHKLCFFLLSEQATNQGDRFSGSNTPQTPSTAFSRIDIFSECLSDVGTSIMACYFALWNGIWNLIESPI